VILSLLIKATVLLVVVLTAGRLARRARASVRHAMLAVTFAALAMLPIAATLAPAIDLPVLATTVPSAPLELGARDAMRTPAATSAGAGVSADALGAKTEPAARDSAEGMGASPGLVTTAIWATGATAILLSLVAGIYRVHRLRRTAVPHLETQRLMAALLVETNVRTPIDVVVHEDISAPLTCGALRPAVVLPADAERWSTPALTRALVHELEHVKRRDWIVQIATRTVCAVYWFHPLVWIAYRQLCLQAEHACDDAVVAQDEDTVYADQLVTLARRMAARPAVAVLGMAQRTELAARVSAILDPSRARGPAGALRATLTAFAFGALLLGLAPLQFVAARAMESGALPPPRDGGVQRPVRDTNSPAADARSPVEDVDSPTPLGAPSGPTTRRSANNTQPEPTLREQIDSVSEPFQRVRAARFERVLVETAEEGDIREVQTLLDAGANVNAVAPGDGTPLIAASRGGHLDLVRLLLDRGADINLAAPGDGNPLIMASREGHLAVVQLLVDRGADLERIVPGDENALMQASASGQLDVVRYLVGRGASIHARIWVEQVWGRQGGEWRSPLSMALRHGHRAVADFLIDAGAVP
jgi:beta-lactamase regulating signal transducer with metallopeptidase domain